MICHNCYRFIYDEKSMDDGLCGFCIENRIIAATLVNRHEKFKGTGGFGHIEKGHGANIIDKGPPE